MQRVKENEMVSVQQKEWAMHISAATYPELLSTERSKDVSKRVSQILRVLGVEPKLAGYRCLIHAIPMVADDPSVLLKEIYPDIAKQCYLNDYRCVERTIRSAIWKAWENRDDAVWSQYFPRNKTGEIIRPTNKEFIARLAEEL